MAKTKYKLQNKFSGSLFKSVAIHLICFFALVTTMSESSTPPIMVSLQKDPNQKTIKAGIINHKPVELAKQTPPAPKPPEPKPKLPEPKQPPQEDPKVKQKLAEQQKALELAKLQKAQQAAAAKKTAELKQLQQAKLDAAKQQLAKLEAERKAAAVKQQAAMKQEAAVKAQKDRLVAEHTLALQSEIDRYKAEFAAAVEDNRILSAAFPGNIKCKIRIKLLPTGDILSVNIVESSGNPAYDEMSQSAVYKTAPFPMPSDHELCGQLRDIVLTFRNGEQSADA